MRRPASFDDIPAIVFPVGQASRLPRAKGPPPFPAKGTR